MHWINKTARAFLFISFELRQDRTGDNHVRQVFGQLVNHDFSVFIVYVVAQILGQHLIHILDIGDAIGDHLAAVQIGIVNPDAVDIDGRVVGADGNAHTLCLLEFFIVRVLDSTRGYPIDIGNNEAGFGCLFHNEADAHMLVFLELHGHVRYLGLQINALGSHAQAAPASEAGEDNRVIVQNVTSGKFNLNRLSAVSEVGLERFKRDIDAGVTSNPEHRRAIYIQPAIAGIVESGKLRVNVSALPFRFVGSVVGAACGGEIEAEIAGDRADLVLGFGNGKREGA